MAIIFKILHDYFVMKGSIVYIIALMGCLITMKFSRYMKIYTFNDLKPDNKNDWEVKAQKYLAEMGALISLICILRNLYRAIMMNL